MYQLTRPWYKLLCKFFYGSIDKRTSLPYHGFDYGKKNVLWYNKQMYKLTKPWCKLLCKRFGGSIDKHTSLPYHGLDNGKMFYGTSLQYHDIYHYVKCFMVQQTSVITNYTLA